MSRKNKTPFGPTLQMSYRLAVSQTSSGFSAEVALQESILLLARGGQVPLVLLSVNILRASHSWKIKTDAPENAQTTPADRVCSVLKQTASQRENDHPGYPCGKAHWAFVTGVGPFAEIGVGLGEPYRADKQHPTRKAPGGFRNPRSHLESATPSAKHILPQNADHFAEAGKMVLWGTDRA